MPPRRNRYFERDANEDDPMLSQIYSSRTANVRGRTNCRSDDYDFVPRFRTCTGEWRGTLRYHSGLLSPVLANQRCAASGARAALCTCAASATAGEHRSVGSAADPHIGSIGIPLWGISLSRLVVR